MRHGRNDDAFLCTSFPVLAKVWNMMSGQAREGRLELRARSRVASSCGRPVCREARDSFLVICKGQKTRGWPIRQVDLLREESQRFFSA